jgi:hypothetical protein
MIAEQMDTDWQGVAEQRRRALAEAEEWADQLGRVRGWLQEELVARCNELREVRRQNEQLAGELAGLREEFESTKQALAHARAELAHVEQSRGYRLIRWVRGRLLPAHTLRGKLVRKSVRVTLRLLRGR